MRFPPAALHLFGPAALAVTTLALTGLVGGEGVARPHPAGAQTSELSVEDCTEVEAGQTFEITITVTGVNQLLAWDVLYAFNRDVVEVIDRDVRLFLETLPNSNVFDVSDPVPNSSGIYRLGAADTGGNGTAESGAGVLATLTLTAKKRGLSWSGAYRGDVDGNGTTDLGPTLSTLGGGHIGDNDGDTIFDGKINLGQIAVDRPCVDLIPTPPPPPGVLPVLDPSSDATAEGSGGNPMEDPDASPGPGQTGDTEENTPTPTEDPERDSSRTRTPVDGSPGADPGGGGDSGMPMSSWLIGLLAGSLAVGVVLSYVVLKTARRPA